MQESVTQRLLEMKVSEQAITLLAELEDAVQLKDMQFDSDTLPQVILGLEVLTLPPPLLGTYVHEAASAGYVWAFKLGVYYERQNTKLAALLKDVEL